VKASKRDRKVVSPATAAQEREAKEREAACKGGKPFSEEPVELDPSKKQLIVNFVSQSVSDAEFAQLFEQFGTLSASRIIYDKHTHRSKGYGFVYFKHGEDAMGAIKHLNGMEVYQKLLKVGYAHPQRPTPPPSPRGGDHDHHTATSTPADDDGGDDDLGTDSDEEVNEDVEVEGALT
jgi:RNA recognition motif-containing protein